MPKKETKKSGGNDAIVLVGIIAGALILPSILGKKDEGGGSAPMVLSLGGGDTPAFDLGGILGSLGSGEGQPITDLSGGLNDLFSGLGNLFGGGGLLGSGGGLDFSGLGGGSTQPVDTTNVFDVVTKALQEPANIIKTAGESIATSAMGVGGGINLAGSGLKEIAKSAAIGAGTYLGFKALQPVAPVVGRSIATTVQAVSKPAVKVATSLAGNISKALTSPVSKVLTGSVGGAVGTVLSVAGAGALGYGVGTALMKYTPLGEVTGKLSEKAASTSVGKSILYGTGLVQKPAELNVSKVESAFAKYGYTTADVQSWIKSGMSASAIQAKLRGG